MCGRCWPGISRSPTTTHRAKNFHALDLDATLGPSVMLFSFRLEGELVGRRGAERLDECRRPEVVA
jgi:hypothetical protein